MSAELEVKRSRFRCELEPVGDVEAARAVVAAARKQYWDARHHCSAFLLGPDAAIARSSDDGEPSGTAGAPMLEALRGAGLTEVVAVVTRWFGGTLLGTGGLVRAYRDSVRLAVAEAQIREVRRLQLVTVMVDPGQAGRVETELRRRGVAVLDTDWGHRVELQLGIAPTEQAELKAVLGELTGGSAELVVSGERWL